MKRQLGDAQAWDRSIQKIFTHQRSCTRLADGSYRIERTHLQQSHRQREREGSQVMITMVTTDETDACPCRCCRLAPVRRIPPSLQ
jgi:hypothetical protein